ncbi:MAG: hypothetical protein ABH834_06215 [Candidatus Altiarchaeota archaeon]
MPRILSQKGFAGKKAELDFTPFATPTTVANAAERMAALQERLVDRPVDPYAVALEFSLDLKGKALPNPVFLQNLYPSTVQGFKAGIKLTPSTLLDWDGTEGQFTVFTMKYGIKMHEWDRETIRQVSRIAKEKHPQLTHVTSDYWGVDEPPEGTTHARKYTGATDDGFTTHIEDISAFFGLHLVFLGQGKGEEPRAIVCANPIQTQTLREYRPDESGAGLLHKIMLGVLDTQLALTKGKPDMMDARAHWGNQRRLIKKGVRNIFYPQDKQVAAIPLLHYACNVLGVDTLAYYDFSLDPQKWTEAYSDYEFMSRIAAEAGGGKHNPRRIVKYTKGMYVKDS